MGAGEDDHGEKRDLGCSSESESPGVRVHEAALRGMIGVDQRFEEKGEEGDVRRGRHCRRFWE